MPENDPKKDFVADQLLQTHETTIGNLVDRVTLIEDKLKNPEQLAILLESASSDSRRMDRVFSRIFCNMMKGDDDVRKSIEDKIAAIDRAKVKALLSKFGGMAGFAIWSLFLVVFTAAVTALIDHYTKR